jgi:hypothetical protein
MRADRPMDGRQLGHRSSTVTLRRFSRTLYRIQETNRRTSGRTRASLSGSESGKSHTTRGQSWTEVQLWAPQSYPRLRNSGVDHASSTSDISVHNKAAGSQTEGVPMGYGLPRYRPRTCRPQGKTPCSTLDEGPGSPDRFLRRRSLQFATGRPIGEEETGPPLSGPMGVDLDTRERAGPVLAISLRVETSGSRGLHAALHRIAGRTRRSSSDAFLAEAPSS